MSDSVEPLLSGTFIDSSKRKKVISNKFIERLQKRHYMLLDVLPFAGSIISVYLFISGIIPFGFIEVIGFVLMWLITGLGVSAGYHRLFTHRSFHAKPMLRKFLHIAGMMAGQGGVTSWTATHRRHHELSDKTGDPHSPNLHGEGFSNWIKGVAHSHFTWMKKHEYPSVVHYAPDLLKDKSATLLDKYYYQFVLLGLIIPGLLSGFYYGTIEGLISGLLFGGVVRLCWVGNTVWFINSILHKVGTRRFKTSDKSHNLGILAIITFGESWHNNHHAFPGSPSFALDWYRVDPAFWFIKICQIIGLANNVNVPDSKKLSKKL